MIRIATTPRSRLLAAAAAAALLMLTACAGTPESAPNGGGDAAPEELTTVDYQLSWLKITQFGGLFAAESQGYLAEEGIQANFTAGGANILAWQQVTGGRALLGDEDNTLLLQAIESGEDLVALGAIFQASPLAIMSFNDNPIRTAADFEGKTVAFPENGIDQLRSALEANGVNLDAVTIIPGGADPTQLVTGQVDGYGGYSTSQGAPLEVQGLDVNYLYLADLGVPSYGNVLFTTRANLTENRDLIVRFLAGVIRGYEWFQSHPEEAIDLLVTEINPTGGLDVPTETKVVEIQNELMTNPEGWLRLDVDKFQEIIDGLVTAGTLSGPLTLPALSTLLCLTRHTIAQG